MYILGENPAMSDPDQTKTRLALSQLEHLIVQDIFFTETASFADVIFPATAQPEKSGTYTNSNRQIQIAKQIRTPPGNARQDWELITEIAKRCGYDWKYKEVKDVFNEMSIFMNSLNNITWERLEKEDAVCYPSKNINQPGDEVIFTDGIKLRLDERHWLMFRFSGTEPLLRIYCEAPDIEELQKNLHWAKKYAEAI